MVRVDQGDDALARVIEPLEPPRKMGVIPSKTNRKTLRGDEKEFYKARHVIENFFAKRKPFRTLATRYNQRAVYFLAPLDLVSSVNWFN